MSASPVTERETALKPRFVIPTPKTRQRTRFLSRHAIRKVFFSVGVFLLYVLLNRPEIILLSKLGMTVWYPAAGLSFAVMLGASPWYMPLFVAANGLAGVLMYGQPVFSWGTLVGAPLETAIYAYAAYLLRSHLRIDSTLSRRYDVVRYVPTVTASAVFSAFVGVACLWADHTVTSKQLWGSGLGWFFGDAIGVISLAPFLLIHVLPRINEWLATRQIEDAGQSPEDDRNDKRASSKSTPIAVLEFTAQAISFAALFWFMFAREGKIRLDYLAFLPVIWIAMRHGIRGIVTGLLALNFGIVLSLQLVPTTSELVTELGFLMMAFSCTGLLLGSAVTERRGIADELNERTIFLKSLIGNSPFGIVVQDRNSGITLVNHSFLDLFQYGVFEVIGRNLDELVVPPDQRTTCGEITSRVHSGQAVHETVRRMRKDGSKVDVELHAIPLGKNGQIQGGYAIYKDISEQVKAARAAKEYEQDLDRWVNELQLRTTQITLLNETSEALQRCGSSEEAYQTAAQSTRRLLGECHAGALYVRKPSEKSLTRVAIWGDEMEEEFFTAEDCVALRLGRPYWNECPSEGIVCAHVDNSKPITRLCVPMIAHDEPIGVLSLLFTSSVENEDLEAEQKGRESLKRLAVAAASPIALSLVNLWLREALREESIRDPLTGLFNRRFMQEALSKELQRAQRKHHSVTVLFLDLDHFKKFNDTFGHDAGDLVLQSVAHALRTHFRAEDVVCRYGGEEFAVILPETSAEAALERAIGLRVAAKGLKLTYRGMPLDQVTLSIGIASYPKHSADARELLKQADNCLYQSKANGRDRITVASQPSPAPTPG